MPDDLSDAWAEIRALKKDIERLKAANPLEAASVTNGRLRFIGGLLLIDSGGTLTVVGHLNGEGDFVWNGPWALKGAGEITGDVSVTGDLELLDDGVFRSENVRIEDGKIYVGAGGNLIVIDGATGKITAGSLTIDPASNGGSVKFAGGPEVYASGAMLALYSSSAGSFIELGSTAKINGPGARWIEINSTGFQFVGLPTKTTTETGFPAGSPWFDSSGYMYRVV